MAGPKIKIRSLIRILNTDGLCLARSVCVGLARAEFGPASGKFRKMAKNIFDAQTHAAIRLLEKAKIPTNLNNYNLEHVHKIQVNFGLNTLEIPKIQRFLGNSARIIIIDAESHNKVVYKGNSHGKNIFIVLAKGHFQPIGNPRELFRVKL